MTTNRTLPTGGPFSAPSLRRQLQAVALVYVIEGFPMGIYAQVFGFYLRSHDAALSTLGILGAFSLAWSVKPLWSPWVERYGTRHDWIRGALLAMAVALVGVALLPATPVGMLLWGALALYCVASATSDIAIDAYTIGLIDRGQEGPANAVRMAAYRVGMILAGGGILFLPRWIGWSGAFLAAAGLSVVFALSLRWTPPVPLLPPEERRPVEALARWASRPGLPAVVLFVLLFRIGDKAMAPMVAPLWVDRGFSPEAYATFSSALGALATIAGAVVGGAWVSARGLVSALWWTGAFALLSNLVYAAAALPDSGPFAIYTAGAVESFTGGAVGAAFVAYLMRICEKEHAAVQYAALTGIYALAGSILAAASGWITEALDYAGYFALTAAFATPAFLFLPAAMRWLVYAPLPEAAAQDSGPASS
ncbi:MAG: MFS transporter [Myxococcota bacterium]